MLRISLECHHYWTSESGAAAFVCFMFCVISYAASKWFYKNRVLVTSGVYNHHSTKPKTVVTLVRAARSLSA